MTTKEVTHILGDGTVQTLTRLYSDEGKVLTNDNGATIWECVDVSDTTGWSEIPAPPDEEDATDEEIIEALEGII